MPPTYAERAQYNHHIIESNQSKMNNKYGNTIAIGLTTTLFIFVMLLPPISQFAKDRGVVGDMIGGILNPLISILGAWLIFRSFQAQLHANQIQIELLNFERSERKKSFEKEERVRNQSDIERHVKWSLEMIEKKIERIAYCMHKATGEVFAQYSGINAIYRFAVDFKTAHNNAWSHNEIIPEQIIFILHNFIALSGTIDTFEGENRNLIGEVAILYAGTIKKSISTLLSRGIYPDPIESQCNEIKRLKEMLEDVLDRMCKETISTPISDVKKL